jgi:Fic family protein
VALVEHWGLLNESLMYLSGFLKQHQQRYHQRLSEVRTDGNGEAWVWFFLEGVETAAHQAEQSVLAQASLIHADRRKLLAAPKASVVAIACSSFCPPCLVSRIEGVRRALDTTFPTATAAVNLLEGMGIVTETTGQKKNLCHSYAACIGLMSD